MTATAASKMNLMQKLNKVIVDLQAMNLKKTGLNKSEKRQFYYYELADFLPYINELCTQHGIHKQIWFTNKYAYLRLTDTENKEDQLLYTSPMRAAAMPMSQPIQLLGAEQTYQRRYLLMNAFEIVENDVVDSQPLEQNQPKPATPSKPAPAPSKPATPADGQKTFPGSNVQPGNVEPPAPEKPKPAVKMITEPQQKRLKARAGGDQAIIDALLKAKQIASIKDIPMGKVYEDIVTQAEKMAANKQGAIATPPAPVAPPEPEISDEDVPF